MGKLHRLKRRVEKSTLKRLGLRETELGELRTVTSKAEARRRALRRHYIGMCQRNIFEIMAAKAAADIAAEEDARCFAAIDAMVAEVTTTSTA